LLACLLKLPPVNAFQFRVDLGSVHKLQYLDNYTYINYINL
jgi:alpha-ribazole phosphatase